MKALFISVCLFLVANLYPDSAGERLEKYFNSFVSDLPGSALLADKLELEGLVLTNFSTDTKKPYTIVSPNQTVDFEMDYVIDPEETSSDTLHHYV